MKIKYMSAIIFIISSLLFLTSCTASQERPVITSSPTVTVTTEDKGSITDGSSDLIDESIEGDTEETAESPGPDLKKIQELESSFILIDVFQELSFEQPLDLQVPDDNSGRFFIVEQGGRIFMIDSLSGKKAELFLDITDRVNDNGNEKGLLGLAFHPDFKDNGEFYVNYTTSDSTVVSRFKIDNDSKAVADPNSEEVIITFLQPYSNHNGGDISFGPDDGYLYIATGDGGGAGDPGKNGQNLQTLLGKILRLDINNKEPGLNYSIPADNPFKGNEEGYREEIYAYGLRNPWRFSFDPVTGLLWAADVGQDKVEEIDIIKKGKNYGWDIMEGSYCYEPPTDCDPSGLEMPVYEYEHPIGKSITGGYIYRGDEIPVLNGLYIYADFVTGYIWGLFYSESEGVKNFNLLDTDLNISSFGIDSEQRLYITAFDGKIYKLALP